MALYLILILTVLGMCTAYAGTICVGAIKMQNLESRTWGIVASIMAMIPIHIFGLAMIGGMILRYLLTMVFDAGSRGMFLGGYLISLWISSLTVGIWSLVTLMRQDVIDGFEYKGE